MNGCPLMAAAPLDAAFIKVSMVITLDDTSKYVQAVVQLMRKPPTPGKYTVARLDKTGGCQSPGYFFDAAALEVTAYSLLYLDFNGALWLRTGSDYSGSAAVMVEIDS
jgi:hypothetical protein